MAKISDLVAEWDVELSDKIHKIQFEHGTLSGKRVIWVDGKEIYRKDFVFELVGSENFNLMGNKMRISISASALDYIYTLQVNNVDIEKFSKQQGKILKTWTFERSGKKFRVALEKDTLDVWVNGEKLNAQGEFVDDGTETHFAIGASIQAYIKATNSGKRNIGIIHRLFVDDQEITNSS